MTCDTNGVSTTPWIRDKKKGLEISKPFSFISHKPQIASLG